ncbi:MAG: hypothetical protein AB1414_10375 [bacterium]
MKELDTYKACEECWKIEDNKDREYSFRKFIIHSEQLARQNAETRESHLQKAEGELHALGKKLNKGKLRGREAIDAMVNKVLCSYNSMFKFFKGIRI